MMWNSAYIASPEEMDWIRDSAKNGEKRMPAISDDAMALMNMSAKKSRKRNRSAKRITVFASPSLKNGIVRGKSISAYENKSVSALR